MQLDGIDLKDHVTLANLACGVIAIALALRGNLAAAGAFIAAGLFFDAADGAIARKGSTPNEFGKELDSLADMVTFGAAPVAIAIAAENDLLAVGAGVVYAVAGAIRLAKFNLQSEKDVYVGLPIPGAAIAATAVTLLFPPAAAAVLGAAAVLMVCSVRIGKISL